MNKIFVSVIICLALFCSQLDAQNAAGHDGFNGLGLTENEKQFIRNNPSIVLGGGASFEPFIMADSDGSIIGHDAEIARLIGKMAGLDIRFKLGEWFDIQKQAEGREIDGLTSTAHHPERTAFCSYTLPYVKFTSFVFVRKGNPLGIHRPGDLFQNRGAFQKGNLAFTKIVSSYVDDDKSRYYTTIHDVIRAVVSGDADFFVLDETAFYVSAGLGLGGFIEPAFPLGDPFDLSFCLRNDIPELVSIFNKGIKRIPQAEKIKIRDKWFGYQHRSSQTGEGAGISLTSGERAYLIEKKVIRGCPGGNGMLPQRGIASDLFPLVKGRLGLDSSLFLYEMKSGDIDALVKGTCDFVVFADSNYNQRDDLNLTRPIMSFPYVLATTMDKIYIEDLGNETDKIFAVLNAPVFIDRLKRAYPAIKLLAVPEIRDGLDAVRSGRAFGYIDSYVAMAYAIQNQLMPGIKITGQLKFNEDFCMATRQENKLLAQILQKVVGSIGEAEKKKILDKWISVKYEKGINYTLVWGVAAASLLVLTGIAYWNRSLNKEKKRAQKALAAQKEAVKQNINFIDMISHEYRTPMSVIFSSLELMEMKLPGAVCPSIKPQLDDLKKSSERLVDIFNTALHEKRISEKGISSHLEAVDLNNIILTAIEYAQDRMPENEIVFHSDSTRIFMKADPDMMGIAIGNILNNACKYSKHNAAVEIFLDKTQDNAVIRIKDNGIGIHKDELHRIFEKYYRADSVREIPGAGVGLYLVKKVVEQHGGNISISSKLGKGTRVVVRLPL
ncbi:MAG: transporter substrate-binding domain-containing protein [Desulfobacterales bacterium]|nr:transporter substrate-binding domain-containing protein [Desulfobacterales bacterium]